MTNLSVLFSVTIIGLKLEKIIKCKWACYCHEWLQTIVVDSPPWLKRIRQNRFLHNEKVINLVYSRGEHGDRSDA